MHKPKVILGVTESDSHVVANQLIAYHLKQDGYEVINLGACTPLEDFAQAYSRNPDALAVVVGSLNGHAYSDLEGLATQGFRQRIKCPIILGGNLSVGAAKSGLERDDLRRLGIDIILNNYQKLVPALRSIETSRAEQVVS